MKTIGRFKALLRAKCMKFGKKKKKQKEKENMNHCDQNKPTFIEFIKRYLYFLMGSGIFTLQKFKHDLALGIRRINSLENLNNLLKPFCL